MAYTTPQLAPQLDTTPHYPVQTRLEAYDDRNHGRFHERNRGSKKVGFLGILKTLLSCGQAAGNIAGSCLEP